jgi:hypothetical protein
MKYIIKFKIIIIIEKSIEIDEKRLVSNHSNLAVPYHNSGRVYYQMKEYKAVFDFMKKALDIRERTLSSISS